MFWNSSCSRNIKSYHIWWCCWHWISSTDYQDIIRYEITLEVDLTFSSNQHETNQPISASTNPKAKWKLLRASSRSFNRVSDTFWPWKNSKRYCSICFWCLRNWYSKHHWLQYHQQRFFCWCFGKSKILFCEWNPIMSHNLWLINTESLFLSHKWLLKYNELFIASVFFIFTVKFN